MKKSIYHIISLAVILPLCMYILCGCVESKGAHKEKFSDAETVKADNSPTEAAEIAIESGSVEPINPVIWYSDITQDGFDEKIEVDLTYVINYPETGEEQTVSIYSGSTGQLIWTEHADIVHPGWNGVYIYNDGTNEYLLIWKPMIYNDAADFSFQIFSLTDEGEAQELTSETLQFDLLHVNEDDKNAITAYVDKVNSYLENSYVLVDTDKGEPVYSTENNKISNCYDISYILNEAED